MSWVTALHISYTVSAARLAAVRASISTPVLPQVWQELWITTACLASSRLRDTSTWYRGMLWHNGINWLVSLAPWIPAIWATASTSPFFIWFCLTILNAFSPRRTTAPATAVLLESGFPPTSTIVARPSSSVWVKLSEARGTLVQDPESLVWNSDPEHTSLDWQSTGTWPTEASRHFVSNVELGSFWKTQYPRSWVCRIPVAMCHCFSGWDSGRKSCPVKLFFIDAFPFCLGKLALKVGRWLNVWPQCFEFGGFCRASWHRGNDINAGSGETTKSNMRRTSY